jgi:uncharacterized repeat protein (TIGR01451 family)
MVVAPIFLCTVPAVAAAANIAANDQITEVCFAVADEDASSDGGGQGSPDTLTRMNRFTGVPGTIGLTGTDNIEEIAFGPGHHLYAANGGQLGTLDVNTGLFTALPEAAGDVDSPLGPTITVSDLDGLAYSLVDGVFFGAHRRSFLLLDILVAINPVTGAHIENYFGPGVDYVEVSAVPDDAGAPLTNVDGLTIDPVTGLLYAAINESGRDGVLAVIDTATGTATKHFTFRFPSGEIIDDVEAVSFFNDGTLYASSGDNFLGDLDDLNALFRIDRVTGTGELIGHFPTGLKDFEALGCLTAEASITLKKYTNGPGQPLADADTPTGPGIPVGATVTWTYIFTNTSVITLTQLSLVDDQLGALGPGGLVNCPPAGTILGPGQGFTCVATGTAQPGQYSNVATVTGLTEPNPVIESQTVSDTDPSHYFGLTPGIAIKKFTNGADADGPNGLDVPRIAPGEPVTWTYVVENTGDIAFAKASVVVTDDQTGVTPTFVGVLTGDGDNSLEPGEQWLYQATGTALTLAFDLPDVTVVPGCTAGAGEQGRPTYANVGTVTVGDLSDDDPSHYCNPTIAPPPLTALGDYVWLDANRNGLQDDGETPVSGQTVTLYQVGTATPFSTTTTDAQGLYLFDDLPLGSYFIEITPPPGFSFTTANVQNNGQDALDSDLAGSTVALSVNDQGFRPKLGQPITYTLRYSNTGILDAAGIILATTVPTGTTANLAAGTPGWSCAAIPAGEGTSCEFAVGDLAAGASGSVQFVVILGNDDDTVPDGIQLTVTLGYTTSGRSHVATPPAGGIDPTLDAGLVTGVATEETRLVTIREPVPTALDEEEQPGLPRALFLPAVLD